MSTKLDANQVLKESFDESSGALKVDVVASTGLPPGHAEDSPHSSGDVGSLTLAVRNDAGVALAGDGDYIPLTTDATGQLRVAATFNEGATAADGGALPATVKVVGGYDGANVQVIKTDAAGELQVDVLSSALPTGAATEATLSSIDTKTPALGQAAMAASSPVVIASDQSAVPVSATNLDIRDLSHSQDSVRLGDGTDLANVTAAGELNVLASAQPGVDIGDVTVNNAAGAAAVNIQDGGNSITVDGSVTVSATDLDIRDLTSASDSVAAVQSGTWNINNVSGTVSLPTGASTLAEQQTQTTSLQLLDDAVATTGAAITAKGIAAAGTDGTNARILKTDANGELQVDVLTMPSVTVTATDLDIRDLSAGQDSVRLGDGTDLANVTAAGELNVLASAQPGVDIGDVTVNNAAGAAAVNIQDGGNSITVDGSVTVSSTDLDIRDLTHVSDSVRIGDGTDLANVTAAGELNVLATAQPGVDIGDVTVNNAAGASAVNIQDGGNSITVDGAVTVSSTDLDIRDLTSVSDSVSAVQSGNWSVRAQDGSGNALTSSLVGSNRGLHTSELGFSNSAFVRNDYTSVNVTTAAYVELIASTAAEYQEFEIFDSSGQTLKIAFGAAASEVDQFLVFPGGNGRIKKRVASGTRISIRAVSATADAGEISLNLYG